MKVENHEIYTDYFINKPTNFDIVDEVIERIADEQQSLIVRKGVLLLWSL